MMDDGLQVIVCRDDDSARVKAPSVLLDCCSGSHLVFGRSVLLVNTVND